MPELPEVETIRLNLEKNLPGRIISRIRVLAKKQLTGRLDHALGQNIVAVERQGKYLAIRLGNGYYLNVHLKMTGQFLFAKNPRQTKFPHRIPFVHGQRMPGKTTRVIIEFSDRSQLFYNDLRMFGWIKITKTPQFPSAPDVLSARFTRRYFHQVVGRTHRAIKALLLDQEKQAGIGNIYANEALFAVKIHPLQPANRLNQKQVDQLYAAIIKIMKQAIKHRGTSASDEAFILPDSRKGRHQHYLLVYDREDQPCRICGTPIKRLKHHGRSSYFCPRCQTT
ncbi:bifunctional DNA-formamidopyrimidine glycosylase/DNA-(apurinic or apyrimidinic site) lyase [Patescibacteria group bacterium]|nr:bifunctional DNA-formamidopyrimidine glycosylase/DNA-(apurinic or apyrimidinic site) lyase [Patescibacteria group bacterium]MCL5091463.1 bifunctional DNA-formamidopyrimidine glycosylase/DNA-(apurinic or apyrimidinic site) lyase [Patescibacteria group bacterium]